MNKRGGQGTDFRDNSFKVEQCNSKATQQLTDATPEFHSCIRIPTTIPWSLHSLGKNLKSQIEWRGPT